MLGKLIKYDMRSCWKTFLPFWAAILILTLVNAFTIRYAANVSDSFLVSVLPALLLLGTCMITFVVAIVYICQEFSRGLLGKSGYLMFTLPVKTEALVASKGITALILECISGVIVVLGLLLELTAINAGSLPELPRKFFKAFAEYPELRQATLLVFEGILLAASAAIAFNERIHVSIAVGHLAKKHRTVIAFLTYVIIGAILSFLGIRGMMLADRLVPDLQITPSMTGRMTLLLLGLTLLNLLIAAVYFFITSFILKRRLNLE